MGHCRDHHLQLVLWTRLLPDLPDAIADCQLDRSCSSLECGSAAIPVRRSWRRGRHCRRYLLTAIPETRLHLNRCSLRKNTKENCYAIRVSVCLGCLVAACARWSSDLQGALCLLP